MSNRIDEYLTPAQKALLPTDKYDSNNGVAQLSTLSAAEFAPFIPALLHWLEDANWPCFDSVAKLVLKYPEIIVEPVRDAMRNNKNYDGDRNFDDGEWMVNLLVYVIDTLPVDLRGKLREELLRIRDSPTLDEKENEADEYAAKTLKGIDGEVEAETEKQMVD